MNYIVGDIGNTLTKVSLLNQNYKIVKSYIIETNKLNNKIILTKFLKKIIFKNINKKILFSSVVPITYNLIKKYLSKKNFTTIELKDLNIKNIIKLNVDNYRQLGSDRIANAIGSLEYPKKNIIIIDFGTATTFDVVNKNKNYDGGVIAPGINLSILNLHKSTSLLPSLKLKKSNKPYGKNTKDAMNAGFLWGYQGLINNVIKKISKGRKNYIVILTGGYATLFRKYLSKKSIVDQNITIKGIISVYKNLI